MKVLLDSCVSPKLIPELSAAGHDVDQVADWGADPGDEHVLDAAIGAGRTLITLDKDFGEFAVVGGVVHYGIIRLVDIRIRDQALRCVDVLARFGDELARGAIVTVEPTRVRVRESRP